MMIESPTSIERARKRPFFAKAQIRPLEGNSLYLSMSAD